MNTAETSTVETEAHSPAIKSLPVCLCRLLSQQSNVCHCSASRVWRVTSDERTVAAGGQIGRATEATESYFL